jgi:chromosomal replication initiation ATPase DnaA
MTTQRPPREQQNHGGTMNDEQSHAVRPNGRPVSVNIIIEETCRALRVQPHNLYSTERHHRLGVARGLATMLMRELTTLSYPEIAKRLNRPNHSSVITAEERVNRQIESGLAIGPESDRVNASTVYVRVRTASLLRQEAEDKAA